MAPITETHDLILGKLSQRMLRDDVIGSNRDGLLASINNRSLAMAGWTLEADLEKDHGKGWQQFGLKGDYRYELYIKVIYSSPAGKEPDNAVLQTIYKNVYLRAAQPKTGRWELTHVDAEEYELNEEASLYGAKSRDFVEYTELKFPDNWPEYFDHLFGLDSHVKRIRSAMEAGLQSDWSNRYHAALIGPPGCGKSDVCRSIKRALGEEAVAEYDATATTAAGIIKDLSEREILPRVLVVEEIEKSEERQLTPLLAIMDQRSEIRKQTARASIQRDTKLFCIATVNNRALFEKMASGALASRFAHKIFFKRPNRDQLTMILQREVTKVEGNFAWIDPALNWCDSQNISDPRQVTAICLSGRDELITGEYQKWLEHTNSPDGELSWDDTGLTEDWTNL